MTTRRKQRRQRIGANRARRRLRWHNSKLGKVYERGGSFEVEEPVTAKLVVEHHGYLITSTL